MTTKRTDIDRLDGIIRRLFGARDTIPSVRATIDDFIADAMETQGAGKGAGISDPTGARAGRLSPLQQRHRRLTDAVGGVERAVQHLLMTAEGCLSAPRSDQDASGGTDAPTCPTMTLRKSMLGTITSTARSEILVRCGRLTAHKLDEHGNPIGYDPDGLCLEHRREADEAMRAADGALATRLTQKLRSA